MPDRRRPLSSNIVASAASTVATTATGLASVPIVIGVGGVTGYGIWAVLRTFLVYATSTEIGLGPGIQRYVAVAGRDHDSAQLAARKALFSALTLFLVIAAMFAVVAWFTAVPFSETLTQSQAQADSAEQLIRLLGLAAVPLLGAIAVGNVLQGQERFVPFALTNGVGSITLLAGLVLVATAGGTIGDLGWAVVAQFSAVLVLRLVVVHRLVFSSGPRLMSRADFRHLLGYSGRLQLAGIATVLNTQSDKVVVGLFAGSTAAGYVAIGSQLAESLRLLLGAALPPITSRMGALVRTPDALRMFQARTQRIWSRALAASVGLLVGACPGLIQAWLGGDHGAAPAYAAILLTAYGASQLVVPLQARLRAEGRLRPELTFVWVTGGVNLVLSVALGFAFGAYGIVSATAFAYLAGVLVFAKLGAHDDHSSKVASGETLLIFSVSAIAGLLVALSSGAILDSLHLGAGVGLLVFGPLFLLPPAAMFMILWRRRLLPTNRTLESST